MIQVKIIGRILLITIVFSVFSGLFVAVVNASGANAPDFNGTSQFRPTDKDGGGRPEGRDGGNSGLRLVFGMTKNIVVVGVLVAAIVWPKSVLKKKRKLTLINSNDSSV